MRPPKGVGAYVHHYTPGSGDGARTTLLLLHGTGGTEDDLVPLARLLSRDAAILSPRGTVLENGMSRYFRRIAEGVFDLEDLERRTHELGDFVVEAAEHYAFDPAQVIAVGFSNGANIAGNLLLRRPGVLGGAALLSPMTLPDLSGVPVFIGAGRTDTVAPPDGVERLAALLRSAGAEVTLHWEAGGHTIGPIEVDAARRWLEDVVES